MSKITVVVLMIGAAWTAWALPQLAEGVAELPGHWWSAPGPALLVTGGLIATLGYRRRRRTG